MSRVLVVGCWDEAAGLPRTESVVGALVALGHQVEECYVEAPVHDRSSPRSWATRFRAQQRTRARVRAAVRAALARGPLDMVLVPYPGASTVNWVRSLFGGPIVLDLFRASEGELAQLVQGSVRDDALTRASMRIDRVACRAADLVLVDTSIQADHLARITGLPRTRFGVVPICDPDDPLAAPVPRHVPGAPLRLLLFGKGMPVEGLTTWIEAMRRSPSTHLQMVGGSASARQIVQAALGSRVDVVGGFLPMNRLRERIVDAHLVGGVVDPSPVVARTVPYRVAHALAHGRPVLGALTDGLRGVLEPGVNSVGVPMSDAGAVSLALERLARDPSVLGPMGEAARATYELQFSPERVRHRLEELLGNRLGFRSVPCPTSHPRRRLLGSAS